LTNPLRPWDLWGAVRAGLKAAHVSWSRSPAPARRVARVAAALKKPVTFTLREEAIQLARDSGVTPSASAMAKIEGSPIDGSLGSDRLCRHVTLTLAEAAQVHDYYRRAADAFTKIGDTSRALTCANARASIRLALWTAERSKPA